jgi:fructokinase
VDPNVRLNARLNVERDVERDVEQDVDVWRARVDAFVAHADLIKVSAKDLGTLWPRVDPAAIAERWRVGGPAPVVITDGAKGARRSARSAKVTSPAARLR